MKTNIKQYRSLLMFLALSFIVFAYTAFAQSPEAGVVDPMAPVELDAFLKLLMASLGGMKGASALAIAAVISQLVVAFLKTPLMGKLFSKVNGLWKIAIVLALSLVSGVLGLMSQGVSLSAALVHSTTLSALMVLGNQIYQHFAAKPKV